MSDLQDIREYNAFHLTSPADCGSPDNSESVGARFLLGVRDAVLEHVEAAGEDRDAIREAVESLQEDAANEIADAAVPIYTGELWATFVDLQAYLEDVTELGAEASDMEQCAKVALYMIAERLTRALGAELQEWVDDLGADDGHWTVVGPDGEQLAGPFGTEQEADDEAAAMMSADDAEGAVSVAYVSDPASD